MKKRNIFLGGGIFVLILSIVFISSFVIIEITDTDGGFSPFERGTCSPDNNQTEYKDSCVSRESLLEFAPIGNDCIGRLVSCPCLRGRCVECVPLTCEYLGYQCGVISDGCGRILNCGSCDSGYNCLNGICIEE